MSDAQVVELLDSVDRLVQRVHTQSLDISFNELLAMYEADPQELDISPDYQRLFRWSVGAQSRFIESLVLEMPVPPIYVVEEDTGKYLLIDGLQRISSYLHLRGSLSAPHLDPPVTTGENLTLSECDIIPELNGKTFDDLGTALQIRLKRAFVRVEVVRKGSDARFKYHMFKRLNTGGILLTEQQLRNCTIRLLDKRFAEFLEELSTESAFSKVKAVLSKESLLGSYDNELVLRFFALKNSRDTFRHNLGDFLTDYMEVVSDPESTVTFDYQHEKEIFIKTFSIFKRALEERAFGRGGSDPLIPQKNLNVYHFEAFTIGLQAVLNRLNVEDDTDIEKVRTEVLDIKSSDDFVSMTTGGGKNRPNALNERIGFVESRLVDIFT